MEKGGFIPDEDYRKIVENVPVCCVDLVVIKGGKVLLIKREDEPLKGEWCVPGGRVYKNETLKEAVKRKAKEELGVDVSIIKGLKPYEYFFDKTAASDKGGIHNIGFAFIVEPKEGQEIKLDTTSSEYRWIEKIDKDLNHFVREILDDFEMLKEGEEIK